jgi:hypothetical protein
MTYIIQSLICQFTRRVHITLGLRYLKDYLFQQKQLSHDKKQFKMYQKGFCISIPFTHWMNISSAIGIKFQGCLHNMYKLIDLTEFLLQSSL